MTSQFSPDLLRNRTAFIAGGTSGINLGIAHQFAHCGAKVFVLGRSQEKIDSAVAELSAYGHGAAGYSADVRDYAAVAAALAQCAEKFGPIDIVVSGAAGNFVAKASEISSNGFKAVVDIDLVGSFHVCRAAYEHLRRPASIILISAPQAFVPTANQAHVCAAKAGIDALTRVLAIEWGPEGIAVNAIAPGPVDGTEGMKRLTPTPAHRDRMNQTIPLRRYAKIEEIAGVATFLCSPAGSYFNGEVLVCDGGQSLLGGGATAALA
jgi:NAD(P)-dependent dehydrogenase (short-subunit alcohol dehydrogenase family)